MTFDDFGSVIELGSVKSRPGAGLYEAKRAGRTRTRTLYSG
jgi:hypothetical protein